MPHPPARILVVDDEEVMRDVITSALEKEGFTCVPAPGVTEACASAEKHRFDLVITDLNMPGRNGIELVKHMRQHYPATGVLVVTAFPDRDRVRIMEELEVDNLIVKPFTMGQLRFTVLGALEKQRAGGHGTSADTVESNGCGSEYGLVGTSTYIRRLRNEIRLMASGDFPVLVTGASGTGKEIVAHAIHENSARRFHPMIAINCAAIPRHLEESEFFGYVKGAFTGAHSTKLGILESADRSTLFLDEIGELSLEVQAKLLRVLDSGEYVRVGETTHRKVDIRVMSATNRTLEEMVGQGTFRKDLYYRLKGASVTTAPLGEHKDDIPQLVHHFIGIHNARKDITADAMGSLINYSWPGNIRELRHTVDLLCNASKGLKRINSATVRSVLRLPDDAGSGVAFSDAKEAFEKTYFTSLLRKHNGNVSAAAREADMHRPNLIRKLKELGVVAEEFREIAAQTH